MSSSNPVSSSVERAEIPLKLDIFLQTLLSHLANTLEDVVGLQDASGFISIVGTLMGEEINEYYREALDNEQLSPQQVAEVMVDLKRRIEGDFYIIEQNEAKIILGNRRCPLGTMVKGHPSLCMMTSSVFGVIASQNLGYAKVVLEKTIAQGDEGCRVVVYLKPTTEANLAEGREYYRI